jgi:FtsH-binding integral membrane protein
MAETDEDWTIELAAAKVDRGADRIERVYSWAVEGILAVVRAALAVAGSIVGVAIAAVFEEVGRVGARQIVIAVAGLCISSGVVLYQYARLRRLYGNYLESLHLFTVVQVREETDSWIP